MKLKLEAGLAHQLKAIAAVADVFEGVRFEPPARAYENPAFALDYAKIGENVAAIQAREGVPAARRAADRDGGRLHLDVKMETGTGKTYVYTRLMFELHKRYGVNKFVIVVPSLPIKAGTGAFLEDGDAAAHFRDACGYGAKIEAGVVETAKKAKNKGRLYFPGAVAEFVRGSAHASDRIHALLLNMQLLTGGKLLTRDDYDTDAEGFVRPVDAVAATRPFVFVDEPHRFDEKGAAYRAIEEKLRPQCIVRFGATFPESKKKAGKGRAGAGGAAGGKGAAAGDGRDYRNLVYDLGACAAFNEGLVKGVAKEHFEPPAGANGYAQIVGIEPKASLRVKLAKDGEAAKPFTLKAGDSMGIVDDAFRGVVVDAIGKDAAAFSNGVEKRKGDKLMLAAFMGSYQEQMLRLALRRHFETERENFATETARIKTLALFFIDDIASYRGEGDAAYLRRTFERCLSDATDATLAALGPDEGDYRAFLEATKANLPGSHAGYFAQDNADGDESVAQEVKEILHGKARLLSLKNPDGSWNVRRFLFSKWTLKEGWDNPNVFTIAKLRSSGSETSKLQEVGRGLRLPVDENGNRIANRDFRLNYIVDFTERDFADRLVAEINGDGGAAGGAGTAALTISDALLEEAAKKWGVSADEFFDELRPKKYIDRKMTIDPERYGEMIAEYPELSGLRGGKVVNRNKKPDHKVKIRKEPFEKLRALWMRINQRYALAYDADVDADIPAALKGLLVNDVFVDATLLSKREVVEGTGTPAGVLLARESGVQVRIGNALPYGEFLRKTSLATNLPVSVLHEAIRDYAAGHGPIPDSRFNETSAENLAAKFHEWRVANLMGRFRYARTKASVNRTALTDAKGAPLPDIVQGRIGTSIEKGEPCDKYLYEEWTYDSPLEKKNVMADIDEVVVYGKVPRRSIAIPTIAGGTFSPDFIYVVRRRDGSQELNLVVETKDVAAKSELREEEKIKIRCAEVFFDNLRDEGFSVRFRPQLKNDEMKTLVEAAAGL